jgi:crossover junction endonuclease MUS81
MSSEELETTSTSELEPDQTQTIPNIVTLTLDIRERDIIAHCTSKNIPFQTASLKVGDMLLKSPTETLVFERKTLADLEASIKDGRYREQKQRLKSTFPFHRITYVIEGTLNSRASKSSISALISSRYRDGFQVLHTSGVADTVWHLSQIQERMSIPDKTAFDPSNGEYASAVKSKTKKCENLTPEMTYLMQLAQIPGLSMTIAQDIAKVYPCFSALLKAIGENGAKAFDAIAGMGKMRSKKMLEYIR